MRFVQMGRAGKNHIGAKPRAYAQRVMVRVRYVKNKGADSGHWKAHGRYNSRGEANPDRSGFDSVSDAVDYASKVDDWQKANDPHMFKVIISPEFGYFW